MSRRRYDHHLARRLARRAHYRQEGLCFWCKQPMILVKTTHNERDPRLMTAEHLVPVYAGGLTRPGNIVAACCECNNSRNPETNRMKAPGTIIVSVGDDEPSSPFEVLRLVARYQR